jgi:acyl-CoA synthetase (AMP-forming)/AMP-acid ligase II/pimeloyl-ACP methyl ester carboxylesterase
VSPPAPTHPAALPPAGLPGLDPAWSRIVEAVGSDGAVRRWHVLDTHAGRSGATAQPLGTVLAVHGNPTWSYLWRDLLAGAPPGWRVVAVDHLGMGFSDRVDHAQRLADRVHDLGAVADALGIDGPVVTVAHDWGGPICLGWALAHRDRLAGVVLTNTAVSRPAGSPVPALIALARTPGVLPTFCVRTSGFLDGTLRLAHPSLAPDVRAGFRAPYRTAGRRRAIGDFVADIPLSPGHPSAATLDAIAAGLGDLADVPVLLLWGPRDPVFSDRYLRDLSGRLPHAQVHRFEGAGHLLAQDADVAGAVAAWLNPQRWLNPGRWLNPERDLDRSVTTPRGGARSAQDRRDSRAGPRALWAAIAERGQDDSAAVVELSGEQRSVSWRQLDETSRDLAAGLALSGVRAGDRVAVLVPPGPDLVAAVYGCWRAGAVVVVADAGLGLRGLTRAVRGAAPSMVIGIPRALAAARTLGWPGRRVLAGPAGATLRRSVGAELTLAGLRAAGRAASGPTAPGPDDEAAVLFTSGATGPAKGVVYTHRQLQAQRDLLAATYGVGVHDRLVAAFAPFALYGPALGITSAVPAMDVTAPATLTATALAEAAQAVDATLVFGSPAALANVVATAGALTPAHRDALGAVRLVLSAGAPVPLALLERVASLTPKASLHTPYGMTEVLPVTDISLDGLREARADRAATAAAGGVCVGRPLAGVRIEVLPLDDRGRPDPQVRAATSSPGTSGEIVVHAGHVKLRYDSLWATQQASITADGGHRTGDVGHLDVSGRLWVEGRLVHVVSSPAGPVTPVGVEQVVEELPQVSRAALVGVGPAGTQAVVLVVEPVPGSGRLKGSVHPGLAEPALAAAVRASAGGITRDVAAVLVVPALPVDIRHNSKIDRTRLAGWAERVLSGGRAGRP